MAQERSTHGATPPAGTSLGFWRGYLRRLGLFFGIWLLLTEAAADGLVFGAAASALGAASALAERGASWPLDLMGWLRFLPWFLLRSLVAGWDVLGRALSPRRPLDPDWLDFETRLVNPAARRLLAGTVSLLPGTLVARLEGARLLVHVLDRRRPVAAELRELETRIAALYRNEPRLPEGVR